ncbi:RNA-binding protein [Haloferula luteola]|uniref:RNA-binding protein n=1 Tax=Haloferula luteola TaxID=595692 RepID=UPI00160A6EC6
MACPGAGIGRLRGGGLGSSVELKRSVWFAGGRAKTTDDMMMKLFVGNLNPETPLGELRDALAEFEPILDVQRPVDRQTGKPRGFAFVTFASMEAAANAKEVIQGLELGGQALRADDASDRGGDDHPAARQRRVSMKVREERVDDRPTRSDGRRVRYKSI